MAAKDGYIGSLTAAQETALTSLLSKAEDAAKEAGVENVRVAGVLLSVCGSCDACALPSGLSHACCRGPLHACTSP